MESGANLSGKESRADVFMMAFDSLSKLEKELVASRLLDDVQLREAVLDIGGVREWEAELDRPLEKNLADGATNEG